MRLIVAVLAALAVAGVALAHDAPSGWEYPSDCCHGVGAGGDCHPVPCETLVEERDGLHWRNFHFTKDQVRPSKDRQCHVCVGTNGDGEMKYPHCAFVLPTT
jgi:hypothetical protein